MAEKISLAMIVRNCAEDLDVCLKSVAEHVDEIVIVNTAIDESEPGYEETNEVARKYGANLFFFPWCNDFSKARQFSFEKCAYDNVMWLDSDDEVINARRLLINARRAFENGVNVIFVQYLYEWDEKGNCTTCLLRERFVDRRWFEWRAPIHECLCATWKARGATIPPAGGQVNHRRTHSDKNRAKVSLDRNQEVFSHNFTKGDPEARMLFYWANTRVGLDDFEGAIELYKKYIPLTGSLPEKCVAFCSLAECYRNTGQFEKSMQAATKAISVIPTSPTAHVQLSGALFCLKDYDRAIHYANEALRYNEREEGRFELVHNPKALAGRPHVLLACSYFCKGDIESAGKHIDQAHRYYSDDEMVCKVKENVDQIRAKKNLTRSVLHVHEMLKMEGNHDLAEKLLVEAPVLVREEAIITRNITRSFPEDKRSILFFCPPCGGEVNWGPEDIGKGTGGSEEAVINMAAEFNKLGWHVEVYNNRQDTKDYDGVTWRPVGNWRGVSDAVADVVVFWRAASAPLQYGVSARTTWLWCHDIPDRGGWERNNHKLFNGIFVLSKYHKKLYDFVPEDHLIVSRNGMDGSLYVPLDDLENVPTRMIWGSCPSRGLERVLKSWPEIKSAVPEAEIHIYYGWGPTYIAHMNSLGPGSYMEREYKSIEELRKQDGVHWHGRVGQRELNAAYAKAGIWGYPTSFPEISCITAMKAQAHGCMPICTDDYALSETVQFGVKMETPPEERLDLWVDAVKYCMQSPPTKEARLEMARWARQNTWASVAAEWEATFKDRLENLSLPMKLSAGDLQQARWMLSTT